MASADNISQGREAAHDSSLSASAGARSNLEVTRLNEPNEAGGLLPCSPKVAGIIVIGIIVLGLAVVVGVVMTSGSSETVTTSTQTTSTITTLITTTTITTTNTWPGSCVSPGFDPAKGPTIAEWCFCFYTGECLDHFHCNTGESLPDCQLRECREKPTEVTSVATSFFNFDNHNDVLTIPSLFWKDIGDLKVNCADGGLASVIEMLEAGRRVYQDKFSTAAEWQCVHLPGQVGVYWMHIHTFKGDLPDEKLPGYPPTASCAEATKTAQEAATEMLSRVTSQTSVLF